MKMSKLHHVKTLFLSLLFTSLLSITTFNVILTNFQVGASASPNGTVMAVDPTLSTANPNQHFTVNFTITNVTNLYSWQLKLKWQPAPLLDIDASNITEGPFLKQGGSTIFPKSAFRDHIDVACNLAGTPPGTPWNPITPQNGSGLLASATFKVTDTGNSTLELYDTVLIGWNYTSGTTYEINHTTVNGKFYTTYPVAKFTYTPSPQESPGRPIVGETVTFNASASYDPDQFYKGQTGTGIDDYEWDFGDGTFGAGNITTHVYDEAGVYYVTLNVTDDDVEKYSETYPPEGLNIQFHDIAVINVTVTPTEVSPGGTVTINATVLNQGSAKEYMNVTAYCNLYPVNTTLFTYLKWVGYNWVPTQYLLKGENATTSITWNVGEIPEGDYTISVETFIVTQTTPHVAIPGIEREENLYDNGMIGGTLTITGEEKRDLAVTNIVVDPTDLELLESSDIRLSIQNKGTVDEQINATLTVYKDSSIFKTRLLEGGNVTVKAGETKTLEWTGWLKATATMEEGLYNITASVSIVNSTTLEEIQDNAGQGMLDNVDSIPVNMRIFPKAHFTYSPTGPFVDEAVTFNATASYAPGATQGTIMYTWDFGDGMSKKDETSPVIFHIYTSNGTFTVTLKVAEGGLTKSVTHDVTINPFHNLAITNVAFSPNAVTSGEPFSINVTIENTGYFEENFNVTTYYYENEIVTQTSITLMADAETTLTFTWDTTGVAGGNYLIKAVVTSAAEEIETTDNTRIGGTATITKLTSSITLSASPTTMTIGGSTTLTGSITPTRSGINVTIWIRKSGEEWSEHDTVTTDGNGGFSYSWTPPSAGSYGVKVRWLGDEVTQSGESDVQAVEVKEALTSNVFLYTTIAFALLSVAIVAYFIWARKTKPT